MTKSLSLTIRSMSYGSEGPQLLKDFDLQIPSGQLVSVVGPSGCGKTTLLRIIAGLEKKFDGQVTIGEDVVRGPSKRIQILFQEHHLLPWLRASDNVAFPHASPKSAPSVRRSHELMNVFGIDHRDQAWLSELSGGERSRIALARAFMEPSDVLLLDEPLRSLDLPTRNSLLPTLVGLLQDQKTTTIMVSHDIEDAVIFSDRILVVAAKPMRVLRDITLTIPRDRLRADEEVRGIGLEILRAMTEE